jgi:predicted nucleic acid-binding protein
MRALFADTFYYLALVSKDDAAHRRVVDLSRSLRGRTVTTAWVLTEMADALAAPRQRGVFAALLERLLADPNVTIVPPSQDLFQRGIGLYNSRPDKEWSLTDCISFVVMDSHSLSDALTADHHFEQAGYTLLLK